MNNLQSLKLLISKMAGNENHLTVNTTFVHFMDSLEGGVFLSQLVYWSDKTKRSDGYFYKTYDEWKKEICISKHAVMKNVGRLKDMGVLDTKVKKANGNPTLHYMLHYDRLCELIISFLQNQTPESSKTEKGKFVDELSLTENTTENTTEIKKTSRHKFEICDMENAQLLFDLMLHNNPNTKHPNLEAWANEFRLIRTADKRTDDQVKYLINWTQNDSFWKSNILSPQKLRKQFDSLVVKIKAERERKYTHNQKEISPWRKDAYAATTSGAFDDNDRERLPERIQGGKGASLSDLLLDTNKV